MKRLLIFIFSLLPGLLWAQIPAKPDAGWFRDAKLGMFVHFGPYSVLGSGEWVMNNRPVEGKAYMRLQELFNPHAFDAGEWVAAARRAGAKYITFTSRHHDGFSNWATAQSDWNIMNTPFGRDLLRELADECQRQDMKLMLYYSLIDWMRTDYPWETGRTGQKTGRTGPSDRDAYFEFMKAQLTELLTGYGPIAGIWFDGHWDQTADENRTDQSANIDWRYDELYGLIRSLQPDCLIANNHHLPIFPGEDYQIFERDVPGENKAGYSGQRVEERLPLETCQTMNDSWGFRITDDNFKTADELITLLVRTSGRGANLLLNVGPMPDGRLQPECIERLEAIGSWTEKYGHTIYGTEMGPVEPRDWGVITKKDNTLYLHVFDPDAAEIKFPAGGKVRDISWINTADEISGYFWDQDRRSGEVSIGFTGAYEGPCAIFEITLK